MRITATTAWFLSTAALLAAGPARAGSSNSLLDVSPDGNRLARRQHRQRHRHRRRPRRARKALREIKVGDKPEGVAWIGNGPLAAVTVYREDKRRLPRRRRPARSSKRSAVADEPYGIVADKRRHAGLGHARIPRHRSARSTWQARKVVREIQVGAVRPRASPSAPTRSALYVTEFYTGVLHAVDLATGKVVDTWKGHATDNLCRHVVVHPTRPKAYLSHIRSHDRASTTAAARSSRSSSVCDLVPPDEGKRRDVRSAWTRSTASTSSTNPWEAALSPDGKRLYTIYAGTDDMNVSEVIDDDYKEIERIGGAVQRRPEPAGRPRQPRRQDGLHLQRARLRRRRPRRATPCGSSPTIKVCEPPKTPEWVRGKVLFNTAKPPMTEPPLDRVLVVPPGRPARRPRLAEPRGAAQDAGAVRPGAHAPAALVGRPRRGAGLRVHDPRQADAGRRPAPRTDQAEGRLPAGRAGETTVGPVQGPRRPGRSTPTRSSSPLSPHIPAPGKLTAGGRARQGAVLPQGGRLRHLPQRAVLHRQHA